MAKSAHKLTQLGHSFVVGSSGIRDQDASILFHVLVDHCVVEVASNVIKVNVHTIWHSLAQGVTEVDLLIVEDVVKAQFVFAPIDLLFTSRQTDHHTSLGDKIGF